MDSAPTALFDSYEADFKQIIHSIRDKLDGDAKDVQGEQRKAALRRVEMELDEADEMVRVVLLSIRMFVFSLLLPEGVTLFHPKVNQWLGRSLVFWSINALYYASLDGGLRVCVTWWTGGRGLSPPRAPSTTCRPYNGRAIPFTQRLSSYGLCRAPSSQPDAHCLRGTARLGMPTVLLLSTLFPPVDKPEPIY